ncbi:pleckstrin homology (PH) and lipid-binding START domains-containing protein [Actinidia rufa]|uniref:Pleckstrin homology (PH) and lipid-binding START domains-containing protein n=1 Tax=Actinidia rufa TaxID=165716 RepID=A0A7J0EM72_9ERIC|nr:pleckstrin homology (PH) and lipid-binding START domains-containing protein [Actinidia rufa]
MEGLDSKCKRERDRAESCGKASFTAGNYTNAIHHLTVAISLAPDNHVLYSNRSSAHASAIKFTEAFFDAEKANEIKPDWTKGYYRVGTAHMGLRRYDDAVSAYKNGLEIDPNNESLKSGLAAASGTRFTSPFGDVFSGSEMWARLKSNPTTRAFLQQGDFKNKMLDVQENPSTLNRHLKDPRIVQALGVLLNWSDLHRPGVQTCSSKNKAYCTEKDHEVERERSRVLREVEERGSERAREKARKMLLLLRGRDEATAAEEEEAFEGGPSRARHRIRPLFEEDGNVIEVALIKDKRAGLQQGLKHESRNQELLDGARRCVEQINKASCGDLSPEELKEREVKAIQDPEIQSILMDPVMSQVLIDFDENPKAALEHAKNPLVMNKKCQHWDDNPAIMAVGVVDGTSEAVFRTDVPWGMKRRDLLLQRYWRREDDGTYGGGFVISPVNQGKESVVKHMLASDWTFRRSYLRKASARSVTVHMLERVAALRELFRAKAGNYYSSEFSSVEMTKDIGLSQSEKEDVKTEVVQNSDELIKIEEDKMEAETDNVLSGNSSLRGLNDASDEFFDVPEHSDDDQLENDWPSDLSPELHYPVLTTHQTRTLIYTMYWNSMNGTHYHGTFESFPLHPTQQDTYQPRMSMASGFVRKLHDLAVQKKVGYMDLQEVAWEENVSCCYGATLAKDPGCNLPCSWTTADPSTFLIRGESYQQALQKTKAKSTLLQMVAADWIRSDKREDDLGSHPGGIVQIPGSTTYGQALYFMTKTPLEETPILECFVNGDDAYRNSRFKLIPYISKGSWIVKQSVGKKACLVGQALEVKYNRGKNYLELGIDVGSTTVARGVVILVLGYLNNLLIEMAFLIQVIELYSLEFTNSYPNSLSELWTYSTAMLLGLGYDYRMLVHVQASKT